MSDKTTPPDDGRTEPKPDSLPAVCPKCGLPSYRCECDKTTITLELDRETDGRWIAEVLERPGCLAYGDTRLDAVRAALAILDDEVTPDVE